MSELKGLNVRLKSVIVNTCNTIGCKDCDLKWGDDNNTCSASDLGDRISDIEFKELDDKGSINETN